MLKPQGFVTTEALTGKDIVVKSDGKTKIESNQHITRGATLTRAWITVHTQVN